MSNPRVNALAFRIWAYASPLGWDCTIREIADALGEPVIPVRNTIQRRGWGHRVRVSNREQPYNQTPFVGGITKLHEVFQPDAGLDE